MRNEDEKYDRASECSDVFILQILINGGDCSVFGAHISPSDKRILMVSATGEVVVLALGGTTDHSRYSSRRTNDWVKKTWVQRDPDHRGMGRAGAVFISAGARQGPDYAGKVDHGFDTTSAKNIRARLKPLTSEASLFDSMAGIIAS